MKKTFLGLLLGLLATVSFAQQTVTATFTQNTVYQVPLSMIQVQPNTGASGQLTLSFTASISPTVKLNCQFNGALSCSLAFPATTLGVVQQNALDVTATSAMSGFNFLAPTAAGNTLVFFATGQINGGTPPVPVADSGVVFVECAACASTTGDQNVTHVYYALNAPATTNVTFSNIPGTYVFSGYELRGISGFEGGTKLGTKLGTYCNASISYTSSHTNTLQLASMYSMDSSNLSASTYPWIIDQGPIFDNNSATFAHSLVQPTGLGKLVATFPKPCAASRPTMSLISFY